MSLQLCQICHSQTIIRGVQEVCLGCGHAKRSNLIFSTEQEFQPTTQLRRTTQHIKQKQEKVQKSNECLMTHLQEHWVEYLQGFTKQLMCMSRQLKINVQPIWAAYLQRLVNQPLRSNWTVARRGHEQLQKDRSIHSKYMHMEVEVPIKVEETQFSDFEQQELRNFEQVQQNSVLEISHIKKRIKKTKVHDPFYGRRVVKQQLRNGKKDQGSGSSGRKLSSRRRGSIVQEPTLQTSSKGEFIQSVLKSLNLNEVTYLSVVEMHYENYYKPQVEDYQGALDKIKNIKHLSKDHHKEIHLEQFTQEQLKCMPPFMQMEACFLVDVIELLTKCTDNFKYLFVKWLALDLKKQTQYNLRNLQSVSRKIKQLYLHIQDSQINKQQESRTEYSKLQKNEFPLDFSLSLIILYSASIVGDGLLTPRSLVHKIKTKQIGYLGGFSQYVSDQLNQYLTFPQHVPTTSYIRHQSLKFIKYMKLTQTKYNQIQFEQLFIQMCSELDIDDDLLSLLVSISRKVTHLLNVTASEYDQIICGIILFGFKIYLLQNNNPAIDCLNQIDTAIQQINIFPQDYSDLKHCDLDVLKQQLLTEPNYEQYYSDRMTNVKITDKINKLVEYYNDLGTECRTVALQMVECKFSITGYAHEEWESYTTSDFNKEPSELQFLLSLLVEYMDEDKQPILNNYYKIEKLLMQQ